MSERADPRAEAEQYLEKHQIPKLFEQLGAAVVYSKPDNPREFLISELRRIQSCKKSEHTHSLLTDQDIATMFSMFDRNGRGTVTPEQFRAACKHAGIDGDVSPPAESISQEQFVHAIKEALDKQKL